MMDLDLLSGQKGDINRIGKLNTPPLRNLKEGIKIRNISFYGIKHFYGFDIVTGEILHLHIYYQIKTGASWSKSIHLRFEDYVLENSTHHSNGVLIPQSI